jgi:hypothetical protein
LAGRTSRLTAKAECGQNRSFAEPAQCGQNLIFGDPILKRLLFASICLGATVAQAQPIAPGDPATGGYFFYAALDRRCPADDGARKAALDSAKAQFVGNMRDLAAAQFERPNVDAALKERGKQFYAMLESLERNGPPNDELARFDSVLNRASQSELESACALLVRDVSQLIGINQRLKNARP